MAALSSVAPRTFAFIFSGLLNARNDIPQQRWRRRRPLVFKQFNVLGKHRAMIGGAGVSVVDLQLLCSYGAADFVRLSP